MIGITLPMQDKTWGYERNEDSPLYGRLVVGTKSMPIYMWKKPGCKAIASNLTGAVLHRQPVTVLRKTAHKRKWYYYVEATVTHEGKEYPQKGWVRPSLLQEIGEKHHAQG